MKIVNSVDLYSKIVITILFLKKKCRIRKFEEKMAPM